MFTARTIRCCFVSRPSKLGEIINGLDVHLFKRTLGTSPSLSCNKNDDLYPVKKDSSPLKKDSSPLRNDSSPLKNDSSPLKNDSYLRNDSSLKNDSSPLKNNSSPLEKDSPLPKSDSPPQKEDSSPLKNLLNDAASFQDVNPANTEQQWATMPYADGAKVWKQGDFFRKVKKDPRDSTILLFPGQGSQFAGMAKDLMKFPLAKDLFELANYILKYDLLKMCTDGPRNKLDETKYCQPAVMVTSLATLEKLKEERPNAIENCVATGGFSLGEITALVFAGALGFERALQLVQVRAEAMQLACEVHQGAMATVMYGPDSNLNFACKRAKEWAMERGAEVAECRIANYLYPHCKVVAGNEEAIQFLEKNMKEFKLRRVKRIPVNGAFHTDLMAPALEPFKRALLKSDVADPVISVYSNVDGKKYKDAGHIKRQLPKQMVMPVKWEQMMHVMYERDKDEYFPRTFECGPGSSLKTLLKQVNAKAWDTCFSIQP